MLINLKKMENYKEVKFVLQKKDNPELLISEEIGSTKSLVFARKYDYRSDAEKARSFLASIDSDVEIKKIEVSYRLVD